MKIPVSKLRDKDMQNAPRALVRAAEKARKLAGKMITGAAARNRRLVHDTLKPTPGRGR